MTKEDKLEIEFYKNGNAQDVLERFEFSKEEIALVQNAIRTSKLSHPRMKLIFEANELLKTVAKTRKPKLVKPKISEADIKRLESRTMKYKVTPDFDKLIVIASFIFIISVFGLKHMVDNYGLYTYEDAKEYCQDKNLVLPKYLSDIHRSSKTISLYDGETYWDSDGRTIVNTMMGEEYEKKEKNRVFCVSKEEDN